MYTLGDPHLGRRFKTGVPLHRLGQREEMVWEQFANELHRGEGLHVCMGDLFDKFVVPPEVVLRAAQLYQEAAQMAPGRLFVILTGNHDASRDDSKRSSFDLFTALVNDVPNIRVVDSVTQFDGMGFVPYCPFTPVEDQIRQLSDGLDLVFMHHDFTDFGGDHVIPTDLLAEKGLTKVINGHDHVARVETRHGVEVTMTGSMQPYTHAEDKTGDWYVTTYLPIEGDVRWKNVRVLLRDGEELPEDLDCLSLTAKRVAGDEDELEIDTEAFESLDLRAMLGSALDGLTIRKDLMEMFDAE